MHGKVWGRMFCCSVLSLWKAMEIAVLRDQQGFLLLENVRRTRKVLHAELLIGLQLFSMTLSSFLMGSSAQEQGNLHDLAETKWKGHKPTRGSRGSPGSQGEGWAVGAAAFSSFCPSEAAGLARAKTEWMTERKWWDFSKCLPWDRCQHSLDKDAC